MKTQKQATHTPTPWKYQWGIAGETFTLIRNEHDHAPYIHVRERNDAAFIVRAVNAHQELLEVVKLVRRMALVKGQTELGRRCDEAIAKAEGK